MSPGLVSPHSLLSELGDLAGAGVPRHAHHVVPGGGGGVEEGEGRDLPSPVLLGGAHIVDRKQFWVEEILLCNKESVSVERLGGGRGSYRAGGREREGGEGSRPCDGVSVTNTILTTGQLTIALSSEFKMKNFTTSQLNDFCITDKLTRLMPGL